MHPDASTRTLIRSGLQGRDPLLAPGVLAVAAAVSIAASMTTQALMRSARVHVLASSRQTARSGRRTATGVAPDRGAVL